MGSSRLKVTLVNRFWRNSLTDGSGATWAISK